MGIRRTPHPPTCSFDMLETFCQEMQGPQSWVGGLTRSAYRQQLSLSVCEPLRPGQALPFWAVPVAAGIVGDAHRTAVGASLDMIAEGRCAAGLDRGHDPPLAVGQGSGVIDAIGRAMAAEDLRHLERRLHRCVRSDWVA